MTPPSTRIAALFDIHGNVPALDAVLEQVRKAQVDEIVIGGDVLPGPMPREALERLMQLDMPMRFLKGNGDRVVVSQMAGTEPTEVPEAFRPDIRWNARQLQLGHGAFVAGWPKTLRVQVQGLGDVLFCHATPRSDTEIFTRLTAESLLIPVLSEPQVPMVVCGHTHMQFDRMIGTVRVVNAGSVGMPFGDPGAYWLLLGPDVQLQHTMYDLTAAADRIRASAYPSAADFAAKNILNPPTEAQMLQAFTNVSFR